MICYISVLSEFDSWYNDSFVQSDEVKTSAEVGIGARAGTQQPAGQAKATTVVSCYQCIIGLILVHVGLFNTFYNTG